MQVTSARQRHILILARELGSVQVEDLASRFDVTPQTIRKDLNELCDARLLARTHGGAMLTSGVENVAYDARRNLAAREKTIIAHRAASIIPDNCSLFINIGTTTEEVARALVNHKGLLVITNNIHVATILMPRQGMDVILAGGMLRKSDGGVTGESAVEFIRQFKVDHAIIGASAIDDDGAMLDFDYHEVRVAKAIMQNARSVMLVADAMKFTRTAPVRIGHLSDIDTFVTDLAPAEPIVDICRASGVRLEIAGETSANDETLEAAK